MLEWSYLIFFVSTIISDSSKAPPLDETLYQCAPTVVIWWYLISPCDTDVPNFKSTQVSPSGPKLNFGSVTKFVTEDRIELLFHSKNTLLDTLNNNTQVS